MPWQPPASAHLHSGPPSASSSWTGPSLATRLRPNLSGLTAFQREQQFSAHYSDASRVPSPPKRSEWDVLRENHRFIRDGEEAGEVSWEERLARAYESKLFKEFALIDLKHYKSRRLALRWRTAPEVVEGIGEDTCASLRCKWHERVRVPRGGRAGEFNVGVGWEDLSDENDEDRRGGRASHQQERDDAEDRERQRRRRRKDKERTAETTMPGLRSFELPFVYEEAGERKEALVKVRLCPRCTGKLMWKPEEERDSRGVDGRDREENGRERERERQVRREKEREDEREAGWSERRKDGRGQRNEAEEKDRERDRARKRDRETHTQAETQTERERDERRERGRQRKHEAQERGTSRSRSRSPATRDWRERDRRRDER